MNNLTMVSIKKNKTKKAKPELIIVEEYSKTLKTSSIKSIKRCKNGTKKYRLLGPGCYKKKKKENVKQLM